jgi:hypothetical protein
VRLLSVCKLLQHAAITLPGSTVVHVQVLADKLRHGCAAGFADVPTNACTELIALRVMPNAKTDREFINEVCPAA